MRRASRSTVADAVLDHRQQDARCRARARRSRRPESRPRRVPSARPFSSTTSSPIELEGVVLVLSGRRQRARARPRAARRARPAGSSLITGRPGRACGAATTSTSVPAREERRARLPPARRRREGCSTKNAPSSPCGLPTLPIAHSSSTRSRGGDRLVAVDRCTSRFSATNPARAASRSRASPRTARSTSNGVRIGTSARRRRRASRTPRRRPRRPCRRSPR